MDSVTRSLPRNAADTKARILEVAQRFFSERGYAQTGVRDIAEGAGVASSLIIKYFGSKAALFAEALISSLSDATFDESAKPGFGETLRAAIVDPTRRIDAPAMIALSLGDDEARRVAGEALHQHINGAMADWLGAPQAEARAAELLMLSVGFTIFSRYLNVDLPEGAHATLGTWLARTAQAVIDGD